MIGRKQALELIRLLQQPLPTFAVKELRKAYQSYQRNQDSLELVGWLDGLKAQVGRITGEQEKRRAAPLDRSHLHLICFDHLCS